MESEGTVGDSMSSQLLTGCRQTEWFVSLPVKGRKKERGEKTSASQGKVCEETEGTLLPSNSLENSPKTKRQLPPCVHLKWPCVQRALEWG